MAQSSTATTSSVDQDGDGDAFEGLKITDLSGNPEKPCILVETYGCKILFDTCVDLDPISFYAAHRPVEMPIRDVSKPKGPKDSSLLHRESWQPQIVPPRTFSRCLKRKKVHSAEEGTAEDEEQTQPLKSPLSHHEKQIKTFLKKKLKSKDPLTKEQILEGRRQGLVQAIPQVDFVFNNILDLSEIDAVFISNWQSLLGLPFLLAHPDLRCPIYASEPVSLLGGMIAEETIEYLNRVNRPSDGDKAWMRDPVWKDLTHGPFCKRWREFYTSESLKTSLKRITRVTINQPVNFGNDVIVTLCPSGHEIGASNWLIEIQRTKIGYLAASSLDSRHCRNMSADPIKEADHLIVTSMLPPRTPIVSASVAQLIRDTLYTLTHGGNVLFPVDAVGMVYTIVELLHQAMADAGKVFRINIVSPVAKKALAYANVMGEWFNATRRDDLFLAIPKRPYSLHDFVDKGHVFVFNSLAEVFADRFISPCVVFAGHTHLRLGESVFFIDLWHKDPRNLCILTDRAIEERHTLFPMPEGSAMRFVSHPLINRLSFPDLQNLVREHGEKLKSIWMPRNYKNQVHACKGGFGDKSIEFFSPSLPATVCNLPLNATVFWETSDPPKGTTFKGFLSFENDQLQLKSLEESKATDPKVLDDFRGFAADTRGLAQIKGHTKNVPTSVRDKLGTRDIPAPAAKGTRKK